jgi:MFS family permease
LAFWRLGSHLFFYRDALMQTNIPKAYAIRLLFWMHFIASVMIPFYTEWGKLRFVQILFLNAWFMLCMFLFEVPTGAFADLVGRKRSMLLGCGVAIVGTLVYVSHPGFYIFLAAETILACGYTLLSGAEEALVYDTLLALDRSGESKRIFSRMESFKLVGIILGALLGGVIAKYLGLRMPMAMHVVPLTACGLVVLSLREPAQHQVLKRPGWRDLLRGGWEHFAHNRILRMLMLDMLLVGSLAWLVIWFYQALLKNAGVTIVWFGLVHALMCVGQIIFLENISRWEKWLGGKRRLLIITPVASGLCFLLLAWTRQPLLIAAAIVLCATFGLARGPLFMNYFNKFIPSEGRVTTLSMISMFRTLGIFLVNITAGMLADWSIPATMTVIGGAMIGVTVFSGIREEHLVD